MAALRMDANRFIDGQPVTWRRRLDSFKWQICPLCRGRCCFFSTIPKQTKRIQRCTQRISRNPLHRLKSTRHSLTHYMAVFASLFDVVVGFATILANSLSRPMWCRNIFKSIHPKSSPSSSLARAYIDVSPSIFRKSILCALATTSWIIRKYSINRTNRLSHRIDKYL